MSKLPIQLVLSAKEYDILSDFVQSNIDDSHHLRKKSRQVRSTSSDHDPNAAAFRAATRVYLGTSLSLKAVEALLQRLRSRKGQVVPNAKPGISRHRLGLSLASLLFLHRVLYRIFTRLRLQLLHEKVRDISNRYPVIYAALTSRLTPAIGASLSGLALGIYPATQLRITLTIYALVRAAELMYQSANAAGYLKRKPWWVGSWMIQAVAQGQLLHAFVFDRDCFPEVFGDFFLSNTHEYVQAKPEHMSDQVAWPTGRQYIAALSEMANLKWPAFVSPILHPTRNDCLPPTIDPVISPITSRAHPAIQNLSCALLHPSDPSCFVPYLRQILLSFPRIARFFTIYYGALSLLSFKKFLHAPGPFLNSLSQQILRTTVTASGCIATTWASICLFNNTLPHSILPKSRFFVGGVLGGVFAFLDQGKAAHANAMYAVRTSLDSLWKVGKKRQWWRGVRGGDVWIFAASLMVMNVVYDLHRTDSIGKDRSMSLVKLLRGEIEVGLQDQQNGNEQRKRRNA